MKETKVSIIVPIYNTEKHLPDCINSLIEQTHKNIEICLIDDGSTDNSPKICDIFKKKDKRIVVVHKKNAGVSHARNIGIKKASGKILMFVDSDDTIEKNCIEKLLKAYNTNCLPICKIKKHIQIIDSQNNTITNENTIINENHFIWVYQERLMNPPVGRLYSSEIIKNNNIYFKQNISLGEDLLFNFNYLKHIKNIIIINDELYNYRIGNKNSLSQKYRKQMKNIQLELLNNFMSFFHNKVQEEELLKISLHFITSILSNELHKKCNIIKKIINIHSLLEDHEIKKQLEKRKKVINKVDYFLIKNFYIMYILKKRIEVKI